MYLISDTCHHSVVLVGYIDIGVLCVEMLTGICCQCKGLVLNLVSMGSVGSWLVLQWPIQLVVVIACFGVL